MDDGVDDPAIFPDVSCRAHAARNTKQIRLAHEVGRGGRRQVRRERQKRNKRRNSPPRTVSFTRSVDSRNSESARAGPDF
eukprot:8288740-Pyramimonas_sp.AAC.1